MKSEVRPPRARRRRQDCRPVMPPTTKNSGMTCRTQTTGSNQRWLPRVLSDVTVPSGCSTGLTIMVCDATTSARQKNLARSITRSRSGLIACPLPARCRGTIAPLRNLPNRFVGCWPSTLLLLLPPIVGLVRFHGQYREARMSAAAVAVRRPAPGGLAAGQGLRLSLRRTAAPALRVRRRAAASCPGSRPHGGILRPLRASTIEARSMEPQLLKTRVHPTAGCPRATAPTPASAPAARKRL